MWRPAVDGVSEVLHADFPAHSYPLHTHDTWTLLVVDRGAVRYRLGRHEHGALPAMVTLLPPDVPHDGRPVTEAGFRKRVVYLEAGVIAAGTGSTGRPAWTDQALRERVDGLHAALRHPSETFEAETRLALLADELTGRLGRARPRSGPDPRLAARLRVLLDASTVDGLTLAHAADELGTGATHLVRTFGHAYGIPPHRYLLGRRLDLARRLLLTGGRPAEVAAAAGFHDQAHLTRQFKRFLGVTPGVFAAAVGEPGDPRTGKDGPEVARH